MKKGENGEDPVFSNPHEGKSFELSNKIWGVEVSNDNTRAVVKSAKSKRDAKQSGSAGDDRNGQVHGCAEKRKGDELNGDKLLNELDYKKDPVNGRIKKKVKVEVSGEAVNGCWNVSVKKEENDEVSGDGKFSSPSLAIDWYDLGRRIDKGIFWDMDMINSVKARELNEKWNQLLIDELELFVQRTEVINKHAVAVLEAMKKSSFP
ncbi:mediator-associated protein 1-like [Tripterygium wilfordii]|uniref:Mediator-associated protein 1-like n=1 Tax=Tripterygium wilfordii TaxID=458696 RepID=A0A7J7D5B0_TRIWF|nr:mediator-associated protein 1-like [Tripterygium wilfordii]